jgi:20S proteasome subunit beta 2
MGSNDGGFDFELVKRNALLQAKGVPPPRAWKTGTTIAGVIYKVRPSQWRSEQAACTAAA